MKQSFTDPVNQNLSMAISLVPEKKLYEGRAVLLLSNHKSTNAASRWI